MFSISQAIYLLIIYAGLQYAIARWAQSRNTLALRIRQSAIVYSLSLAVFCTSWTYYGSIGLASKQGIQHIALYLGSSLAFIFMIPVFKKMVRIKVHFHTTSIADFISTRYNHSQILAALISILCLVGITPYISIQLKSIISSAELFIANSQDSNSQANFFLSQLDIITVLLMAVFTIMFGVRQLDPTERHPGMMVALAAESLFKLIAFLVVAIFICFLLFDDLSIILKIAQEQYSVSTDFAIFSTPPSVSAWAATLILGMIGVIALPRQFHVGIIECSDERLLDQARWMFPLYLFIINFFVLPIAIAGKAILPFIDNPDLILLNIPIMEEVKFISILVFLGGFAAATGMIMVSAMTLSTMVTNHILLPFIEYCSPLHFLRRKLLYVRWLMVIFILFSGLYYYRAIGDSELIVKIGSISFVAIAQLIPALIIGLFWRRGNKVGAITGIACGTIIWYYTLMLPSVINSGWLDTELLIQGPFGLDWLKPQQLFYFSIDSAIAHSLFWSLSINSALYLLLSEKTQAKYENHEVLDFINIAEGKHHISFHRKLIADICLANKLKLLSELINNYLPNQETQHKLDLCCQRCEINVNDHVDVIQLSQLRSQVTSMLAGIIGMAAANQAIKSVELLNEQEQEILANSYSELLAQSQMSPNELLERVDFFQEKQQILEDHAQRQAEAMKKLEHEHQNTMHAKQQLDSLNQELESRIEERTQDLKLANDELSLAITELESTQDKLIEAHKMASLGRIVAGVAHEINTPIGVVLTAISSLQEELDRITELLDNKHMNKQDLAQFFDYSQQICQLSLENVNRAAHLIGSFKQVAVDQEKQRLDTFLIADCIENSLLNIKSKYNQLKLNMQLECDRELRIKSYPSALVEIMTHLCQNSCIHGFEKTKEGDIQVHCYQQNDTIIIEYQDNGMGLSEEGKKNIFEPFYTTKRGTGGSGLGSHLIFNLVTHLLQGEIKINEDVKQGLGFIIRFPANGLNNDKPESSHHYSI